MNSNEDNYSELERLLMSSRPSTEVRRTAEISYAAGVAVGRSQGLQPLGHRKWLAVLSHSCSALAGSLVVIGVLSMRELNSSSSQPESVVAKSDVPKGAADGNPGLSTIHPQGDWPGSYGKGLTSVMSPRRLDELPRSLYDQILETNDNDQPSPPFTTRSQIF